MKTILTGLAIAAALACSCPTGHSAEVSPGAVGGDPYGRQSSWQAPARDHVWQALQQWMDQLSVDEAARGRVRTVWEESSQLELLDAVSRCMEAADPRVREFLEFCRSPRQSPIVPTFEILDAPEVQGWAGDQLRLVFGRWLVINGYLEEAQEQLAALTTERVVDPAALLFYQAVTDYRLLNKDACLERIERLLDNTPQLPQRYASVARLMQADLEPMSTDSLDEVSRMMARIRLRLDLGRAGSRVRQEEQQVIEKLDKLIESADVPPDLPGPSGPSNGGNQPTSPAQGGLPPGPTGPGDVDQRDQGTDTNWGNLPPKEREAALQQLGEDLPSHYRDVIEEYFRRLASEPSAPTQP